MSTLQQAIEENTAAIRELTAALYSAPIYSKDNPPPAPSPTYHELRAAAAEENLNAPEVPSPSPAAGAAEEAAPGMTYEKDVKPFAIKLAAKDKQAFLDLLAERSVKKGSDIPPQDLPEFLGRIKRVLGE